MTITSTISRVSYAGNGSSTVFPFSYYFLSDADLVVIYHDTVTGIDTVKTLTTDYTVSGEGTPSGGNVTFIIPPPTLTNVIIYRAPLIKQGLDLTENDALPAEDIEEAYDKLTMISQRIDDRVNRSIRLPEGFSETFDAQLPFDVDTPGTTIAVNPDGDGFILGPTITDISGASVSAAEAAASASASAASASNSSTFAGNSSTSASASASSATASATSATAAAASATSANASASAAAASAVDAVNAVAAIVESSANDPDSLVLRDGSGNFAAGAITATQFNGPLNGVANGNLINTNNLLDVGSKPASFNNINPMTTTGDTIYESATNVASRLAGNTTTTKKFLTQTGDGSNSAAPGWNTISTGDVPTLNQNTSGNAATATTATNLSGNITESQVTNLTTDLAAKAPIANPTFTGTVTGTFSGNLTGNVTGNTSGSAGSLSSTLGVAGGGTGQTTANAAFNALSPMTTGGDLIYGGASGVATRLANGTSGQLLQSNGTTAAPTWVAAPSTSPLTTKGDLYGYSTTNARIPIGTDGQILTADAASTPGLKWSAFPGTIAGVNPTVQKLTSGSGTYSLPAGVQYIRVRMVGGGGGGAGSGTSTTMGSGGAGGNTTLGTSLLVANGGGGGAKRGDSAPTGGTASLGTGPIGTALSGSGGSGGSYQNINTISLSGGAGGSTPFSGGGAGGIESSAGSAGIANTGTGGGGAGTNGVADEHSGGGGAAGGYVDAIIASPSSTYAYAIGASGSAGTAGTNGSAGGAGGSGYIEITEYYYALGVASTTLIAGVNPTVQKFTSSTGTYTTPAGVQYIKVRMVGGGGGGGGSGTTGGGVGGSGGGSTFGTSLLVANGGAGGPYANVGGAGGTASLGTGPLGTAIQGATGPTGGGNSTAYFPGGGGATSPLGGAGMGGINGAGGAAIANSGSGGGGGGTQAQSGNYAGEGGAAGGYVDSIITSPAGTYSYAVGAAGTAGTAGTNGYAGGAGGSGYIEVTEFYAALAVGTTSTVAAGTFLAGPTSGSSATPTFRALQIPTIQKFTSGSGTYTPSAGVLWIRIKLVGGGGSGAGGGSTNPAGNSGGNTTFGSSFLTASGGVGTANRNGAAGGAASGGNVANTPGGYSEAGRTSSLGEYPCGGIGGGTVLGPCTPQNIAGTSANPAGLANTGAGSAGGDVNGVSQTGGGGGGGGGYVEHVMATPGATAYSVGAGGAAASAGTGGLASAAGAAGVIIVEEHYQ